LHTRADLNADMNRDINRDMNRDINRDFNRGDVTNLSESSESKGIVGSVVEAAKSAANRVREAIAGENVDTAQRDEYNRDSGMLTERDRNRGMIDDRNKDMMSDKSSGKTTTDKIKDTAYDTKEKIKDTAYDAKEKIKDTSRDIKDNIKGTTYDVKDKSKDTAYDIKDKSKDMAYDIKDKTKDTARDIQDRNRENTSNYSSTYKDTSLSADSDIAADSNKQRLRDVKEKTKDAAKAPLTMLQTMYAAGKEKLQEMSGSNTSTTTTQQETPGTADMFSDNYQPGPAQYETEPTKTEQAKSKLASTTANTADKAENWIAENKHKLSDQADKAQDLAADTKHKANVKAQESGKEPASDTRYYSGVHGQTN